MTRAWVEIDLGALRRNGAVMAARAAALLPMVKADAYGIGAVAATRVLEALAPWGFGVATIDEGRELRDAGVDRPIIVFTPPLPDELAELRAARLTPALGTPAQIDAWRALGAGHEDWHLAIDTGMHRAGVHWNEVWDLRAALQAAPPEGAFTHFHSADVDDDSLAEQDRRFEYAVGQLPSRPKLLHSENSAALARTTKSRWSLARPGIFLYGAGAGARALVKPENVASLKARVAEIHVLEDGDTVSYGATYRAQGERRIATLPVGYADGYRRALGNRAQALVNGRRAPVVGVVTMDMTMIDITDVPCEIGDIVTLIGRDGDRVRDVDTVARDGDLSPYEVLIGLRSRLPRQYVNAP
ncbi:MAG TPA: alanine racemase [Gemmatimonadaceae bacterium]|nr:alanine racemase [Gemmatimonadaceae bacterium]